ncbi:unnamed protein product [Camellia sinensis]
MEANFTRLCSTKSTLVVNDSFPGPVIRVHKGGYRHGVKQPRNPWSDGPEHITQCPIEPGRNFTYEVIFSDEEGTLWWHAHSDWTRNSIHGAIVIYPAPGTTHPFPMPNDEEIIILGSWYKDDLNLLVSEDFLAGGNLPVSDAYLINGQPGDFCNCSKVNLSGIYTNDFPDQPLPYYNFTGEDLPINTTVSTQGTKVKMLNYNETVEIIFQGTNVLDSSETHPMHFHGYNFYVVGSGYANFNPEIDPDKYNLVDPLHVNTIAVPKNGWVTIRFIANNPGV